MKELNYKILPTDIPFNACINIDTNRVTPLTHGFHKYPGKFIPQIPDWAIRKYLSHEKQVVLDPFVGSGTTLVESLKYGFDSLGIDIDPLSCLIAKVKSTPLNPDIFLLISDWVFKNKDEIVHPFMPPTKNLEHWFSGDAIRKLGILRATIDDIKNKFNYIENINDYYEAFIIAFSSIIRRVSNADNQSQKTYVSGTKAKKPAEVYSLFARQVELFLNGFKKIYSLWDGKAKAKTIQTKGEANFLPFLNKNVDLIVTSPPYIKSIDYVYNQMVELFWIGNLFEMDTQEKQNEKRKLYIGTTLVPAKEYEHFFSTSKAINTKLIDSCINQILLDNKNGLKHAFIVYKYFEFMKEHFFAAKSALKNDGRYVMAVGNSTVSNVKINTADIMIELANEQGLKLETRWSYLIKNHFMGFDRGNKGGKITVDHILVFIN